MSSLKYLCRVGLHSWQLERKIRGSEGLGTFVCRRCSATTLRPIPTGAERPNQD